MEKFYLLELHLFHKENKENSRDLLKGQEF